VRRLGATQTKLVRLFGVEFPLLGVASSSVGLAIGYGMQFLVATTLERLMRRRACRCRRRCRTAGHGGRLVLPLASRCRRPASRTSGGARDAPRAGRGAARSALYAGPGTLAALLIWQAET
jgi:hypothetical protein